MLLFIALVGAADFREQIERLAVPTKGLNARSRVLFAGCGDGGTPFADKAEALRWLGVIEGYAPSPPEWFAAETLLLEQAADFEWTENLWPESGALLGSQVVATRLLASRAVLTQEEWGAARGAVVRYVERLTEGPTNLIGVMSGASLLALLAPEGVALRKRLEVVRKASYEKPLMAQVRAAEAARKELRAVLAGL